MSSEKPVKLSKEAKLLLGRMVASGEITPDVGLERGVHYPLLEDLPDWRKVIEELYQQGLVDREVYDRIIKCPQCGSVHVASKYSCPRCGSFNIVRTRVIHHPVCGYTNTEIHYIVDGRSLKCPQCGTALKEEGLDYIVIGTLYECINCGRRMDKPDVVHKCITCGKLFNYKDAVYDALFRFKVTEKGYITYIEGVLKSEVVPQLLRELGLRAEVNAKLKGLSGVEHLVSIAGWRNGDLICIVDFSHPGRELREEVLSEVIKYLDLRPRVLALVVPKATEEEVFFARSQNIALVPLSEVEDKLRDLISSALQA